MPAATSTFKLDWENLDRRFEIENTSKTWPRIKFPPCYRSLGSRTSRPSVGLVNGLPWKHFVKQLLGVVDVGGCSSCWSAGLSAKRCVRSHRGTGSYKASTLVACFLTRALVTVVPCFSVRRPTRMPWSKLYQSVWLRKL